MSENAVDSKVRDNLIETAIKFLSNPNVQRCSIESKQKFLRSKGLTDAEIAKAFEKGSEILNLPSIMREFTFLHRSKRSWLRDHVIPIIIAGGIAYSAYCFYKTFVEKHIFGLNPRRKSTTDSILDLKQSIDLLSGELSALRNEVDRLSSQQNVSSSIRTQIEGLKSDISSVKGILLNRHQFPAPSCSLRAEPPSIPAWQLAAAEAVDAGAADAPGPRPRSQRSASAGSNSSEGDAATKNSDSSLEIIS